MNIAIIGAGNVGGTLGDAWAKQGHAVRFGVRNPDDDKAKAAVAAAGPNASATSQPEAAAWAEVVVLTVPWPAVPDALRTAGDLAGKVLLDCTNPLLPDLSGLAVGHTSSGGERVASLAPGARVVKIFNTTGYANMADADYGGTPATMLYAGDDPAAKATAAALARELGFDPIDFGPLAGARLLEPLALVWISLATSRGLGRDFALNVIRRRGKGAA